MSFIHMFTKLNKHGGLCILLGVLKTYTLTWRQSRYTHTHIHTHKYTHTHYVHTQCTSLVSTDHFAALYKYGSVCKGLIPPPPPPPPTVMTKGEGLSGYYRYLTHHGTFIWMQSRATMMYDSRTGNPSYIVCVNFIIK